jgi:glutamyl-tRNA synthetase
MTVTVRFAPSPTGLLHIGNARMALVNWLFARKANGQMILRLDDTDTERSTPAFASAIEQDLTWLGLLWDRLEKQSDRLSAYDAAFERLKSSGRVYPCFESSEDLEYKRRRAMRAGKPPIYDRAALELSNDDIQSKIAEGEQPHWRFKLNHAEIAFDDLVRGPVSFDGVNLSDPVLVRANGSYLYMMPSTVDDIDMAVSHVIRGEDHVTNSAIQIQLFEALGAVAPTFAHLSLLTDIAGGGLSKRSGSTSLQELASDGIEPMSVNSLLAHLGTSDDIEPCLRIQELVDGFDITHFGRAAAKFDPDRLSSLNASLLHEMSYDAVQDRLNGLGLDHVSPMFWEAVRPNLEKLDDAAIWHGVCFAETAPVIADDDRDFMAEALSLLPGEPWDEDTWGAWTGEIKQATGRKGKMLFLPLRLALSGLDHGPELKKLLPLMGAERTRSRLSGETA